MIFTCKPARSIKLKGQMILCCAITTISEPEVVVKKVVKKDKKDKKTKAIKKKKKMSKDERKILKM